MMKLIFPIIFLGVMSFSKLMSVWHVCLFLPFMCLLSLSMMPLIELLKIVSVWVLVDSLSLSLVFLSLLLLILMILSSGSVVKNNYYSGVYNLMMLMLIFMLLGSFFVSNYLLFYIFFEASLIPTLIIIMGWGYQPERLQAGVYFVLYTLFASLPLLLGLFYMYSFNGSLDMSLINSVMKSNIMNSWGGLILFLCLIFAFLVKMPMFLVHLWLPKAHVEAPVAGSMILAGVLLKLGGYGLCRVLSKFFYWSMKVGPLFIGLSIAGMVFVGVTCCRLNDLKALVAYSSVAHMGLTMAGIFCCFVWGLNGGLMMMVSHGLGSSGLFCMVNIFYERFSSRSMFMNKGILTIMPLFSLMLFLLCCSNISAPPTINLLSEISLMLSLLTYDKIMMLLFPLGSFLGAVFTFFLFSNSQHGKIYGILQNFNLGMFSEFHVLMLHILPINLMILNSNIFLIWI
uniref:NADH-ubiquinone oxidoreductase chain 4 n=1 Tax=Gomphiocephalus hodgsoni TaxID=221270 RepID=Q85QQ6_GOMHO|nr:NADH dehydrogenase subunit 4 [Gomphiocephalus hodgsoni]AAO43666.1 NADH dehydrogenase subunit 4 [Gomphiocephalus hodgsoni]